MENGRWGRTGLKHIRYIKEINMKTTIIIDADTIAVQIGSAVQVAIFTLCLQTGERHGYRPKSM